MGKLVVPISAHDHGRGPVDAKLTLVQYGDLQCPHCAQVHPRLMEIARELSDSLRYVFRHFPLREVHPQAQRAAEAAEAAASQGRFWEMVSLLYANQEHLDDDSLIRYAKKTNLDVGRFKKELSSGVHSARVRSDWLGGVRSGVQGTPTLFIDDEQYEGRFELHSLVGALLKASRGRSAVGAD
jgi:formate-nitrite transporter family protein